MSAIRSSIRACSVVVAAAATTMMLACDNSSTGPKTNNSSLLPIATGRSYVGETTTCAVSSSSQLYCWGLNSSADEYGVNSTILPASPLPVNTTATGIIGMATGHGSHACGIFNDGSAKCWGRNSHGQVGSNDVSSPATVMQYVSGNFSWSSLSTGRLSTCGVTQSHVGYCWGSNQRGEVGNSTRSLNIGSAIPVMVEGSLEFKAIAAGWLHSCGITIAGAAYCWGDNTFGQLGIGTSDSVTHRSPVAVQSNLVFQQITAGSNYNCAIASDKSAYCWGQNNTGQLGDGSVEARFVPTAVQGGLKFRSIIAASGFATGANADPPTLIFGAAAHTCALTDSGTAYCWGWNGAGQVGDGTFVDRYTPTKVAGARAYETIGLGGSHTCGIQGNLVSCWGGNANGQLGNGTFVNSNVPITVSAPFSSN